MVQDYANLFMDYFKQNLLRELSLSVTVIIFLDCWIISFFLHKITVYSRTWNLKLNSK